MTATPDIITITLNPAIDHTVLLEELKPGTVHRATGSSQQAGGKGINVGTMLALGGARVAVTGFLGAGNSVIFEKHFNEHGLLDTFIRVEGDTRTGIKIVASKANDTTDLNLSGATPTKEQCELLLTTVLDLVRPDMWVVIAGSMPAGVETSFLIALIHKLRAAGAKIAVDSSGPALVAAVEAGIDVAKPNEHELAELLGRELPDYASILTAARELSRERVPQLVVSMGGDGALFLSREEALMARALPIKVVSTVGAGDSLLAGYLQGCLQGESQADCARRATVYAWSRLKALVSALPEPEALRERLAEVTVEEIA